MDWIVTLITAVLSGGAVSLVTAITNRRANKRLAETEAEVKDEQGLWTCKRYYDGYLRWRGEVLIILNDIDS